MNKQKIIFLSIFSLIVLLFINSFISEKKIPGTLIKRGLVEKKDIIETVLGSGKIYSKQEKTITAKIGGDIKEILISEGQTVNKDDLLLIIDNNEIQQQLKLADAKTLDLKEQLTEIKNYPSKNRILQAQNALEKSLDNVNRLEKTLKDEEELLAKGFISQIKTQETKNAYKIAQNDLEMAEVNLAQAKEKPKEHEITLIESNLMQAENEYQALKEKDAGQKIKAPFSGTILELNLHKEAKQVTPGFQLLTLADMENLIIKGSIFESDINKLQEGQQVLINLDSSNTLAGTLYFISQKAKAQGNINKFDVEISLNQPSSDLRYAMNVNFQIIIQKKQNILAIPLEYFKFDEQNTFVYKVHKNKLSKTIVTKGIDDNRYGEVLSGLNQGDTVALEL